MRQLDLNNYLKESMQTFEEALEQGFKLDNNAMRSFKFGGIYELCFEPCIFDNQYYVALYREGELMTNKVIIKPGKE